MHTPRRCTNFVRVYFTALLLMNVSFKCVYISALHYKYSFNISARSHRRPGESGRNLVRAALLVRTRHGSEKCKCRAAPGRASVTVI